jgi:superfamily II DNA/RNA helicase
MTLMNITERRINVALDSSAEAEYLQLLNDYFTASERNSRASSIYEKKQMMALKERMAVLCNRNPNKRQSLKTIIREAREGKEKVVVMTKSNAVAMELQEQLLADELTQGVLLLSNQLSIHQVNAVNDRFSKSAESTVLIVTDAVNTGLDFTAANHLAHYDYPLRYADILQRNHRITRQTSYHSEAAVYYLMTSGKIDEFDYQECMNEKEATKGVGPTV